MRAKKKKHDKDNNQLTNTERKKRGANKSCKEQAEALDADALSEQNGSVHKNVVIVTINNKYDNLKTAISQIQIETKSKKLINTVIRNDTNRQKLREMQQQLDPSIKQPLDVINIEKDWSSTYHTIHQLITVLELLNALNEKLRDIGYPALGVITLTILGAPSTLRLHGSLFDLHFKELPYISKELKCKIIGNLREQYTNFT
ncbi:1244_t:CDS:2 [Cetraspora pellucida]|uniref:1244_t:CDS:1 n=1 Tax=Cetraspora pellucida TaxID=1433469 RepID=A0A9N8Z999_9GLOM|nr:1244_t:CDS:2 [Cetraspora pellucida]